MRLLLPVSGFWLLERLIQLYHMGNAAVKRTPPLFVNSDLRTNHAHLSSAEFTRRGGARLPLSFVYVFLKILAEYKGNSTDSFSLTYSCVSLHSQLKTQPPQSGNPKTSRIPELFSVARVKHPEQNLWVPLASWNVFSETCKTSVFL